VSPSGGPGIGKNPAAEKLLHLAVITAEESYGQKHATTALALNNLALWYEHAGQFEKAELLFLRALSAAHPQSIEAASVYHNLGELEQARGRYDRGEMYAQQACEIRLLHHTAEHPDYATDEALLAGNLYGLGKFEEAEPFFWHALAVFEHVFGPTHHETAIHLNNMAANRYATRDYPAAEALYRRSLAIKARVLGERHPSYELTAKNLKMVISAMGQ
jgi:tetratricopeptide (TPR) repeat protein